MLWFLITHNLTQFIQFLDSDDLKTILDFMITQLTQEEPENSTKGHTLISITKRGNGRRPLMNRVEPMRFLEGCYSSCTSYFRSF